jgi:8-oxo-dGTP pyrophosphatase MutT (NUDIX family)
MGSPIPAHLFSVVVVRDGDRFLLVEERDGAWYLPAGRVEPGESFVAAAVRETLEESAMPITLEGILRIEHGVTPGGVRLRVVFLARPAERVPPKSRADEHSRSAAWFTLEAIDPQMLRASEVLEVITHVSRGARVLPLDTIVLEGTGW